MSLGVESHAKDGTRRWMATCQRSVQKANKGKAMISKSVYRSCGLSTVMVFSAWAAPTGNVQAQSSHPARSASSAPTVDAMLALERQAHEAYVKGDGKFFENLLGDKWVAQKGGIRQSKADAIKQISGIKCEASPGWTLTEPRMLKIDNDAYVISYVSNMQGGCTAEGKTEKMPSPVRAATVWVRHGDKWQAVFHGANAIVDPNAPPANAEAAESGTHAHATTKANTDASTRSVTADPLTRELLAVDNAAEDGWMRHDAEKIIATTANDIAFVDIYGTFSADKAATVKAWTSTLCEVSGYKVTNAVGTSVSPTVGILTLTGAYTGTCGGQDIGGLKVFVNEVYVKVGGSWKWVFGFNSLR